MYCTSVAVYRNECLGEVTASQEEYTEGADSTFTHQGHNYSVDRLLALTRSTSVVQFDVLKLGWMIDDNYDVKRMRAADTSVPVCIYQLQPSGEWVTLDGYHRVIKAIYVERRKTIPAKIVTEQMLRTIQ